MAKHHIERPPSFHAAASRRSKRTALAAGICLLVGIVEGAQQPVRSTPSAEGEGIVLEQPSARTPHAYFEALAARPERIGAYSLRSQAQLDSLVKRKPSVFWKYEFDSDSHPRRQDAAKLSKPPRARFDEYPELAEYGTRGDEGVHGNRAVRIPVGIRSGSVVITWDFWWGEEFQTRTGQLDAWKSFFLATGEDTGGRNIYWLAHDHVGNAKAAAGEVSRHHDGPVGDSKLKAAPGVIRSDPFQPTGLGALPTRTFPTMMNRWTRYWLEVRMDVPGREFHEWSEVALDGAPLAGTWDMVTLWIADEQRDPVRILYRVPVPRRDPMLAHFRLAFDSSTNNLRGGGIDGTLVAYARNVVVLHNASVREPTVRSASRLQSPQNVRVVR